MCGFGMDLIFRVAIFVIVLLVILALLRLQQVLLFWTQWEGQRVYDVVRNVILAPLTLGAWTLAWRPRP